MSKSSVNSRRRRRSLSSRTVATFGGLALSVAALSFVGPGTAQADPAPAGCTTDISVPNELTIDCQPGAGAGQHAYIRCTDNAGLRHTHIGTPIGEEGGRSTAVCRPDEAGLT